MSNTLIRRNSAHPQALTDELVKAQQKYAETRNSVIQRATQRVDAIREIKRDLNDEEAQLHEVVAAAK